VVVLALLTRYPEEKKIGVHFAAVFDYSSGLAAEKKKGSFSFLIGNVVFIRTFDECAVKMKRALFSFSYRVFLLIRLMPDAGKLKPNPFFLYPKG
jgi:hypothetical protein